MMMSSAEGPDGFDGPRSFGGFTVGDRVRVTGETDHPEDPVGTVVGFFDGEVYVQFPRAGGEMWSASELLPEP
jgi:hypothetical protein